jgi:hypothetical protein
MSDDPPSTKAWKDSHCRRRVSLLRSRASTVESPPIPAHQDDESPWVDYGRLSLDFRAKFGRSGLFQTAAHLSLLALSAYTGDARRTGHVALRTMCGIRLQIGLTTVAGRCIAVPVTIMARADCAATRRAVRNGVGYDARWGGAASAVIGIVVDVGFAAVFRKAVTIAIASQTSRDRADPVVAVGGRLRERAGDAGVRCTSGLRIRLG